MAQKSMKGPRKVILLAILATILAFVDHYYGSMHSEAYTEPSPVPASVYDYLYKVGTENPGYGLYSYVILPVYSSYRFTRRAQKSFWKGC